MYIEETFKVTKSELDIKPVYVSREKHIEAHFLTYLIVLVLARVLQHKLDKKYSVDNVLEVSVNVYPIILKTIIIYLIFMMKYYKMLELPQVLILIENTCFYKRFKKF